MLGWIADGKLKLRLEHTYALADAPKAHTDLNGRKTANGEVYDMHAISAAHPTLPMPSYARVTNLDNGRSIVVRVNDRGPYAHNRLIDLSIGTGMALSAVMSGVFITNWGLPIAAGIPLAILFGGLIGLVNGLNVAILKIPPFIATLAMMLVAQGLAVRTPHTLTSLPELEAEVGRILGLGYAVDSFGVVLFAGYALEVATFTFVGEVVLIFWLLLRGRRITSTT